MSSGCDGSYFDTIDTEAKGYFLGALFAGGYNYERCGRVTLGLVARDRVVLDAMRDAVRCHGRVLVRQPTVRDGSTRQPYATLTMCSRPMSRRLAVLGCVQAKTAILRFPDAVPADLMRHFLRGFIDHHGGADDHRHVDARGGFHRITTVHLSSTLHFCEGAREFLAPASGCSGFLVRLRCAAPVFQLRFSGRLAAARIGDYLYAGAALFIPRKREAFLRAAAA